jgi:Tfp pilus assembly protein PilE
MTGMWEHSRSLRLALRARSLRLALRARSGQAGLSLVEATLILMVLATLAAVIAPSAADYIEDSRNVKAKADVETIGAAIDRLLGDAGTLCLSMNGSSCTRDASTGRVELLVSGSSVNANEPTVSAASLAVAVNTASATTLNWAGHANEVADAHRDLIDKQFATNAAGYAAVTFPATGGPRVGLGWRGPYMTGPIGLDPWGRMYQASVIFLTVASNAADGTGAGQLRGGWTNNVIVLSAGGNRDVETPFGGTATSAAGDDVIYVVQGATR